MNNTYHTKEDDCLKSIGLFPNVERKYYSFQKHQRVLSIDRTSPQPPKKDSIMDIERLRKKMITLSKKLQNEHIGTIQHSSLRQKSTSKNYSKTQKIQYLSNHSRIHNLAESQVINYTKIKAENRSHSSQKNTQCLKQLPEKQRPLFSIKLLRAFLKSFGGSTRKGLTSVSSHTETLPVPYSSQSDSYLNNSNINGKIKNIKDLEMQACQIMLKNSIKVKQQQTKPKGSICIIRNDFSKHKKREPITKPISQQKKIFLSQRQQINEQPSSSPIKKYSEDILEDLAQLSQSREFTPMNRHIQTEPSLSAWN